MNPATPTPAQRRLLERHLDELDRWTARLDLTTVPRVGAWGRHVVESLALLDAARPAAGARCCDLGSGGGVPGIVVAVMRPDVRLTLVDSDRRKAGFLVHVCGLLELSGVEVVDRRAEALARDPEHAGGYDLVVSRACAPPARLWRLARPLLRPGGRLGALVSASDATAAATALAADPGAAVEEAAAGVLLVRRRDG